MASLATAETRTGTLADRPVRILGRVLTYLALLILSVLMGFPFIWTISSSLKTPAETQ
jgi:ABC-type glycerol-3-phosphate transport system permease component